MSYIETWYILWMIDPNSKEGGIFDGIMIRLGETPDYKKYVLWQTRYEDGYAAGMNVTVSDEEPELPAAYLKVPYGRMEHPASDMWKLFTSKRSDGTYYADTRQALAARLEQEKGS